jgi:hypothetical protein
MGCFHYPGNALIYLLFSFGFCGYLILSFGKTKIFFETFMSVFLWLGFWMKVTVRLVFFDGRYHEPVGNFMKTAEHYDQALMVAFLGVLPLVLVGLVRRKIFTIGVSPLGMKYNLKYLEHFYDKKRTLVISFFFLSFVSVSILNMYFHIYQRGVIPPEGTPFIVYGIFAWLVMFGFSAFGAVILGFELKRKNPAWLGTIFFIVESFFSSSSMLSRGMILNGSSGLFGVLNHFYYKKLKPNIKYLAVCGILFFSLFIVSVLSVNLLRANLHTGQGEELQLTIRKLNLANDKVHMMWLDRWVGAEGLFAVSSYQKKDWSILKEAWNETMREKNLSVYDSTFIKSSYRDVDFSKHHFISIPGAIAFFYYPGKAWFLMLMMALVGIVGWGIEYLMFTYSGRNFVFTSLMSQVVAFRFAHLGYVPKQSYQLFGTILATLVIIVSVNELIKRFKNKVDHQVASQ